MPKDRGKIRVTINNVLMPLYYKDFKCLCGECQDNCCADDWRISFDKQDYEKLQKLEAPPELRQQLDKLIKRTPENKYKFGYAEFNIAANNYHCPLQNSDGLCSLQLSCGVEALPEVCRVFPRRQRYTPTACELSLSLGCEGVLQLLWELAEGIDFTEKELPPYQLKDIYIQRGDNLWLHFFDIRSLCIDILQNRTLPLPERIIILGLALQKLINQDWQKPNVNSWLHFVESLLEDKSLLHNLTNQIPGNQQMFVMQNLNMLNTLNRGSAKWVQTINNAVKLKQIVTMQKGSNKTLQQKIDNSFSLTEYQQHAKDFLIEFSDRDYFFENLVVALSFYMFFPDLNSKEKLWQSYVNLCIIYSFVMFVAITGCAKDKSKNQLFHMIVMAIRVTLHDSDKMDKLNDELFQHESSSLAHMAILLRYI